MIISKTSGKKKAVGNGNCAFNAFILAGLNTIVAGELDIMEEVDNDVTHQAKLIAQQQWLSLLIKAGITDSDDWDNLKKRLKENYATYQSQIKLQEKLQPYLRGESAEENLQQLARYTGDTIEAFVVAFKKYCEPNNNDINDFDDIFKQCKTIENIFNENSMKINKFKPTGFINLKEEEEKEQFKTVSEHEIRQYWNTEGAESFLRYTQVDRVWVGDMELAPLAVKYGVSLYVKAQRFGDQSRHLKSDNGKFKLVDRQLPMLSRLVPAAGIGTINSQEKSSYYFNCINNDELEKKLDSFYEIECQQEKFLEEEKNKIIEFYKTEYIVRPKIILINENANHWDCDDNYGEWLRNAEDEQDKTESPTNEHNSNRMPTTEEGDTSYDGAFSNAPVYYRLKDFFAKLSPKLTKEELEKEKLTLINALTKLAYISVIESHLREALCDSLRNVLNNDIENYVNKKAQVAYPPNLDYRKELDNFNDGNYDYGCDYDGSICPEPPKCWPFNWQSKFEKRENKIERFSLSDLLDKVPMEKGLLGDMLFNEFESGGYIDEIIEALDFSGLDQNRVSYFLHTTECYFPDCNILEDGFLLKVLVDNINDGFDGGRSAFDRNKPTLLIETMSKSDLLKPLILKYNEFSSKNDSLKLQKIWYYLVSVCLILEKNIKYPIDEKILKEHFEIEYNKRKDTDGKMLKSFIKVFPSDSVDNLIYFEESKQNDYTSLPLRSFFHTLETVARGTYERLEVVRQPNKKASPQKDKSTSVNSTDVVKNETTNVVSAMLCFVVSEKSSDNNNLIKKTPNINIRFIKIPLHFDCKTAILSFDEAFTDENDVEKSIGDDLEKGSRISNRPNPLSKDKVNSAKKTMELLLSALKFDEKAKKEMLLQIQNAEVSEPVKLNYLISSDLGKSTEHRHSERVLIRELKSPQNITTIIKNIKQALIGQDMSTLKEYVIHSAVLLAYSYPNSVCDPCGVSFLALQNSYEEGFLCEFIKLVNSDGESENIKLRTYGFNSVTKIQDPSKFRLTVIVGSDKVFLKDPYATLISKHPEAKYESHVNYSPLFNFGINLHYERRGYKIYLLQNFPAKEDLQQYKKCFIVVDKSNFLLDDDSSIDLKEYPQEKLKLYYIKANGNIGHATITDWQKFKDDFREMNKERSCVFHLTNSNVNNLITRNGGYALHKTSHNRFYEYTANSTLHKDNKITIPYNGNLFMSGSKESKLSQKKQKDLENKVTEVVTQCNQSFENK